MKNCPNCNAQLDDSAVFCGTCGTKIAPAQQPNPQQTYQQPVYQQTVYRDPSDHTAEFEAKDISENKVFAMICYLVGLLGVIIAAICSKESAYVKFHMRQSIKMEICSALIGIVAAVLCWTFIVPLCAVVVSIIILVLKIIAFIQVCKGEAKEPGIIKDLKFLK